MHLKMVNRIAIYLVVCCLTICLSIHSFTLRANEGELNKQTQLKINPEASFKLSSDAGIMAQALSIASGQASIVILTQNSSLDAPARGDVHTWKEAVPELQKLGIAPVVFAESRLIGLIQGRAYPASTDPDPKCPYHKSWSQFWSGYERLSDEQKQDLLSEEGFSIATDLNGLPDDLQALVKETVALPDTQSPYRLRLTLSTSVFTAFPDAPKDKVTGNWKWNSWQRETDLKFAEFVTLSHNFTLPKTAAALLNKTLHFKTRTISAQQLKQELERVGDRHIKVAANINWPEQIGIADGEITVGQLVQCLKLAGILEPRYLEGESLLFLGQPVFLNNLLGKGGMTQNEQNQFFNLLSDVLDQKNIDLGPLAHSIFQIPTKALSVDFITTLLSDEPPFEAYKQVGLIPGAIDDEMQQRALTSWQKDYADSSALFIPTISFSVVVERQQKIGGRLMWLTSTTSDTLLTPICPAGN